MAQKYREHRIWNAMNVRNTCIRHNLYTCGTCKEYDNMLKRVGSLYPNTENIQFIAENIVEHSEDQTVSNVMYILLHEAVFITFGIDR